MTIAFTKGYKYRLQENFYKQLVVTLKRDIECGLITLTKDGLLIIRAGYSWDGASGAWHNKTIAEGALVHDALYELLRNAYDDLLLAVEPEMQTWNFMTFREWADSTFIKLCLKNGMSKWRAWYVYRAVRKFGYYSARCKREVYTV